MNENEHDWSELIELMEGAKRGLSFAEGLSDAEVHSAEENYGFQFPPDLRAFLQTALPLGSPPFPNWRLADDPYIREALVSRYMAFSSMSSTVYGSPSGANGQS